MQGTIEITPQAQELAGQAEKMMTGYQGYKIISNAAYTIAADDLKKIKGKMKELDDERKSMTVPLDESKKRIMEFFRKPLDYLTQAETLIKRAMLGYQQEQERIRREEEARILDRQRKEAEKLRERAEAQAAKGNDEKAAALQEKAAEKEMMTPVITSTVEKVAGIQTKTVWKFDIENEVLIPREYLVPDMTKIGQVVRATKGTLKIAGVRIYSEDTIASGRI